MESMKAQKTLSQIEAATIPAVVNPSLRHEDPKARSWAIRQMLRKVGIKGAHVTVGRGSTCAEVRFLGVACPTRESHNRSACPECKRNLDAEKKVSDIILGAFPDMDDRSDSMTDHFDYKFTIHVEEPNVWESRIEPAPQAKAAVPAEMPMAMAQPESSPEYEAVQPEFPPQPERRTLSNAADVWTACRDLETEDREHMVAFFLDVRHRLLGERYTLAIGTVTGVECSPRELYREALARNAVKVIIAHNHPSGDPTQSRQDVEITSRIAGAGTMLGLELLDHVIVGASAFTSMKSKRLF